MSDIQNLDIQKNLKNIKLIIIEVDGCLTNGLVYIDPKGNKIRGYNILDYTAINDIISKGYKVGFISSHNINYLKKPFKKIKLDFLAGKVHHKLEWVKNYIADKYISLNQVVFIGFGLSDTKILKECGISVCPMNAHYKVKEICKIVSEFNGGDGVIYKFLDLFNFNNHQHNHNQPHHQPIQNNINNDNENDNNSNDNNSINSNDTKMHKTRFSGYNYSPRIQRKNNNFGLSS